MKKRLRLKNKFRKVYLGFKDLDFSVGVTGKHASKSFSNGFGVSVITGGYGSVSNPYELAVLKGDHLCYSTSITNDVIGWLRKDNINYYMKKIQQIKG